jgi:tetratricopeptide (TPR) repeat protein
MKILISSTYEDLKDYRRAVREAILRLRQHPVGMEDFGSQPEEWNKAALSELDGCRALVGLYARRYGPIPPGDAVSITEQEFDQAHALGIPSFCYQLDPKGDWPPEYSDGDPGKQQLAAFLKRIDRFLRCPFTSPEQLAQQVVADLTRELGRHGLFLPSALHSLPPPPRDFIGRTAEIDDLTAHLSAGTRVGGLSGKGGIGKTALALVVADRLAAHYPDAQIFLDLQGTAAKPLAPADAMAQVICAFEPTSDLRQVAERDLAARYRSLLHGKRVLLLLDNAHSAAQVKPLLPPPSCAALVTSRRHFQLPGLQPVRLDGLSPTEARALLLALCPRLYGFAAKIAELCGRLPLALRLAGSHLAAWADLVLSDYTAQLQFPRPAALHSPDDPDAEVARVLDLSYDQLPAELQSRFRALAVFPAPFDAGAAVAVWQVDAAAARDVLAEFMRYCLVDYDSATERYSFHALLREAANARLSADERQALTLRHAAYYLRLARAANNLYKKGGDNIFPALTLFGEEFRHIRAGQSFTAATASSDDTAARLCAEYPEAGLYCLHLRLHPREWITWLAAALVAARRLGDRRREGKHLDNLGNAYLSLGESRKAIDYYRQALTIARERGDRRTEGHQLGNLGLAYDSLGEYRQAIECHEQGLTIARASGDRRSEANQLGNLGLAYYSLGEYGTAIEYHEQALAIDRELGDHVGEGIRLGSLGVAYKQLGESPKAIEYYEQAVRIARENGDRQGEGSCLNNLGSAYNSLGEPRKAIEYHEQALTIARERGDRVGEGIRLNNLADDYESLGDLARALPLAESALQIFESIESPYAADARAFVARLREQSSATPRRAKSARSTKTRPTRATKHGSTRKTTSRRARPRPTRQTKPRKK